MADWDQEDFEPEEFQVKKGDQWDGEDEDDDALKENWDDEEQGESKESPAPAPTTKKKSVKQKIFEKEEQRKEEAVKKAKLKEEMAENMKNDDDDDDESMFTSKLEEKLRQQKLVEEADLEVTKDTFGDGDGKKSIDSFEPKTREDFAELAKMIVDKLSHFETSTEFTGFLEILIRDLASGIDAEEVKKLSNVLTRLAQEKQKAQKGPAKKKKPKRAVLGGGAKGTKGVDLSDYTNCTYDDCDDFM